MCPHKSWLHKWLFSESWCWCASGLAWDDANKRYFSRPALRHIVVEPLLAALCDPLIAARVVTVGMCVSGGTCNRWSHHVPSRRIGTHLATANNHCFLCSLSPYPLLEGLSAHLSSTLTRVTYTVHQHSSLTAHSRCTLQDQPRWTTTR